MLTEIYIEALLVDEELANQVWEAWDKGKIDDQVAWMGWWRGGGWPISPRHNELSKNCNIDALGTQTPTTNHESLRREMTGMRWLAVESIVASSCDLLCVVGQHGLKTRFPKGSASSSPAPGTNKNKDIQLFPRIFLTY